MLKRIRHTMCKVGLAGWFWLVLAAPGYTGLWQLQDRAGLLGLAVKLAVSVTVESKTSPFLLMHHPMYDVTKLIFCFYFNQEANMLRSSNYRIIKV